MKINVLILIIVAFLLWNFFIFIYIVMKSPQKQSPLEPQMDMNRLNEMVEELNERAMKQSLINERLVRDAKNIIDALSRKSGTSEVTIKTATVQKVVIPVLVMACDRLTVDSIIKKLLRLRPSDDFPVIVSQDCNHRATREVIQKFGDQITFIMQPDQSNFDLPQKQRHNQGYYRISRHYKWALTQVFDVLNYTSVIIVEDDLDISLDFFEYFRATYDIMKVDPTIWCVSAWNDNGKEEFIDANNPELLYRTDFFPGLGWMLLKDVWKELAPKWPITYWDDWMRHPDQRKGRSCIRPEIPRTSTFGKIGVSKGQYFDKHLKYIKHYTGHVPFTQHNLYYLTKDVYDDSFLNTVYSVTLLSYNDLDDPSKIRASSYRIQYKALSEFVIIAKKMAIMEDLKSDIPRTGYMGVVSTMYHGRRVYICPHPPEGFVQRLPKQSLTEFT